MQFGSKNNNDNMQCSSKKNIFPNDTVIVYLQVFVIQKRECWNSIKRKVVLRVQLWTLVNSICPYIYEAKVNCLLLLCFTAVSSYHCNPFLSIDLSLFDSYFFMSEDTLMYFLFFFSFLFLVKFSLVSSFLFLLTFLREEGFIVYIEQKKIDRLHG